MSATLVYLHGPGESFSRAHALLAEQFHLTYLEVDDSAPEKVRAMEDGQPLNLWAAAGTSPCALAIAAANPERVQALVLEAPPSPGEEAPALANITVPTLVVYGTRDGVTPPETGRAYRETMPNCNYVLLYDAGHAAASDRPEAFASLVGDFLARREAFVVTQRSSRLHP